MIFLPLLSLSYSFPFSLLCRTASVPSLSCSACLCHNLMLWETASPRLTLCFCCRLEDSLTLLTLGPSRAETFWWPCSTPPECMSEGFTVAPSFAPQFHNMGSFRRPRPRFMSSPVLSDLPRFQAARQALQLSSNSAWNRWAGPTWAELLPCNSPAVRAVHVWSLCFRQLMAQLICL